MNSYPDLLATAFRSLTGQSAPEVLSLIFSSNHTGDSEEGSLEGQSEVPDSLLPPGSDRRCLADDETFLEEALNAATDSEAMCIFAFPPLIGDSRLSVKWRDRFGRIGLAEALANSLMSDLEPSRERLRQTVSGVQVLAMLVPRHFVSSLRSSSWRREFFPAHSAVVIEHDHLFGAVTGLPIHVAFQFATIIFQRQAGPIRFFKITEAAMALSEGNVSGDMQRLLRQPAGKSKYGYIYQGPIEENYPCSYDFYSEETDRLRKEIGELGDRVPLSSVADVLIGFSPRPPAPEGERSVTDFLFINATDITLDGRVDLSTVQTQTQPRQVLRFLEDGDLCIRKIYPSDWGFIVGIFEGDGRAIAWSHNVIVVRPHAALKPAQRQVLLSFLRSPLGHRLGNTKQVVSSLGGHLHVTPHVLKDFPVPLADEELVSAIEQLSETRRAFSQWITQIDDESNAILVEATASGSRRRILQAGQLARQRHRAALQVEELDYRIRTQFPHPLAHIWRELQVAGPDRYHRLRAVTKAAEGHTCFLALIAILISRASNQPLRYVQEIGKRLSQRKGGTNFGDWFSIIKEVNESRAFRSSEGILPFVEVTQLCSTDGWEVGVRSLMELRNDDSHGRIAPTSVSATALSEAETALERLYRATEFLTDYRLMFITETRFDSIRRINRFQYRDLTGDNALAQLRHDQMPLPDLEAGSLYLRDRQGQLHLFRPLLQYLECPECRQMSTFFLDTYDGSSGGNSVGLKSFERNSVRIEEFAEDFRHIGLLPTTLSGIESPPR